MRSVKNSDTFLLADAMALRCTRARSDRVCGCPTAVGLDRLRGVRAAWTPGEPCRSDGRAANRV